MQCSWLHHEKQLSKLLQPTAYAKLQEISNSHSLLQKFQDLKITQQQGFRTLHFLINVPNRIAVATTSANKIRISVDGGESWENYLFNLPDFSALTVVWHNNGANGLYVGMDYGIYYIDDALTEWQPYNNNLPNVIINELEIHEDNETLYAGSYGRGLWVSPTTDATVVLGTPANSFADTLVLYPNPASGQVGIRTSVLLTTSVKIYDTVGKLIVFKRHIEIDGSVTLDVSTLQNGVYFVRFNSEMGTATKKLLIK